ncbi:MAG: hypothetical protein V5A28_06600 [Haloarculaceae archaeon]
MTDHGALVRRALAPEAAEAFDRRVREQGDRLVEAVEAGAFDNDALTLGMELEAYAVDEDCRLAELPEAVFDPAAKELGLHNAEINADPTPLSTEGIERQAEALAADLATTRERAREHGLEVVLDAMWTVPPAAGTLDYLNDVEVDAGTGDADPGSAPVVPGPDPEDPVVVARNMRRDPRYGTLDNEALRRADGVIPFEVPGAALAFHSILFESLATSIQPHVQVPAVDAFPRYHDLATRTLGPLLALATNSPFLPADCYGDGDPERVVADTHHELRIAAFEQSMNQACEKVRVPADLDAPTDVVDHVVADDTYAPFLEEWVADERTGPDAGPVDIDACWEFDYKRGTFWRWVRGVVCGDAVDGACDERSLRIEYRPIPTQPTVRDVVGMQVLTAGLLHGLATSDHPLRELPHEAAERAFYSAVEEGLDGDLAWLTADGERTDDRGAVFAEVFEYARRGLAEQGVDAATRDRYLDPIEARVERGVTPSIWKRQRVREALEDGVDFDEAIAAMQREYVRLSRERETFADWPA